MNPLSNVYAEGDPDYEDRHLTPLDPIIVEGEGCRVPPVHDS